jgi:hypothetical protein
LLEPDLVRQWREEAIHHYGHIDFVFELVDGTYRVVEIESPSRQIFTMANEFSQQAQHAMEQSRKWVRGASKSPNVIQKRFGGQVYPEAFLPSVVIGRSSELDNDFKSELWRENKRQFSLFTWDDILSRGANLIRRLNDPLLSETEWE